MRIWLPPAHAAGLVSVGTLNMTEFAYSGIGLNPHYGTPRNPNGTGPARAPGGSSSACGVAVASGLLPLAIGTDTGGSIRIPASFNGVTGYKSSTGHYSMRGVFPLSRTLDSLGPLASSVADCVLADAVLRGLDSPRRRRWRWIVSSSSCPPMSSSTASRPRSPTISKARCSAWPRQGPRSPANPCRSSTRSFH